MIGLRKSVAALVIGGALLLGYAFAACQQEDGLPDPPLRALVPCVPDAAVDDPLACPPRPDLSMPADQSVSADQSVPADLGMPTD